MKTNVINQTKLDELENTILLEKEMNLSTDHVLKLFKDKVAMEKKAYDRRKFAFVSISACVMLVLVINWNSIYTMASGIFTKYTVTVQDSVLTEKDMEPITIIKPDTLEEFGHYYGIKYYSSMEECSAALGIDILTSDLAWNMKSDEKVYMLYPISGMNDVEIFDFRHVIGDLIMFDGGVFQRPTGTKYGTPISLQLEFGITGTEKQTTGVNYDYSGYVYVETYKSTTVREAHILRHSSSDYKAYFNHDNIRYSLTGTVELSELKRIIDSFQ